MLLLLVLWITYYYYYYDYNNYRVSPVDNLVVVKVLQTQHHTAGVEDRAWFTEDIGVYMHHEITTTGKLHDKHCMLLITSHTHTTTTTLPLAYYNYYNNYNCCCYYYKTSVCICIMRSPPRANSITNTACS